MTKTKIVHSIQDNTYVHAEGKKPTNWYCTSEEWPIVQTVLHESSAGCYELLTSTGKTLKPLCAKKILWT